MALFKLKKKQKLTTKKVVTLNENNEATDVIKDFVESQKNIFDAFDLEKSYHVKPFLNNKWTTNDFDGGQILRYWVNENRYDDCVIVKENGESIIREYEEYSVVIALDCVKTAFLFKRENKM